MRALRVYAGENIYWLTGLLMTGVFLLVGWQAYAVVYFGSVLLVGVFSDLEERGQHYFWAGLSSLFLLILIAGGIFAFWISHQGPGWFEALVTQVEEPVQKMFPAGQQLPLQISDVLKQAPSLLVMLYVFSLYFALLFEKRTLANLGVKAPVTRNLINFRVPDAFIWLMIASVLGTFGQWSEASKLHVLSVNAFNVCLLLYFLQGMAVISAFFKKMKISPFWQTLLTVFLAIQLFVFVGALGVVDYWADFRNRMRPKAAQVKKPFMKNK